MGRGRSNFGQNTDQSRWWLKPKNAMSLATLFLLFFGTVWAIVTWVFPAPANSTSEHLLFICDGAGKPQQVAVVGKDGAIVFSDPRGLARIPQSWMGASVSVRNASDWRELLDVKLAADQDGRIRITVSP